MENPILSWNSLSKPSMAHGSWSTGLRSNSLFNKPNNVCMSLVIWGKNDMVFFYQHFFFLFQVIKNNLNPSWKKFTVSLHTFCNGDLNKPIKVENDDRHIVVCNLCSFYLEIWWGTNFGYSLYKRLFSMRNHV